MFALCFVVIVWIVCSCVLEQYNDNVFEICERMKQASILGPVIFTLAVCVLVCAGVPRLSLCPVGGIAFGFCFGLIYCLLGTLLASYCVFLFVRWGGRDFVLKHANRFNKFSHLLQRGGVPAVILARQAPLHGLVIDLILGLSPVTHRDFLIGTLIGLVPEAIPFTLIGKAATQVTWWQSMLYTLLALVVLVWVLVRLNSQRIASAEPESRSGK